MKLLIRTIALMIIGITALTQFGCSSSVEDKQYLHSSVVDGYRIMEQAGNLFNYGKYEDASHYFHSAFNRFVLTDYLPGKFIAASNLVTVYVRMRNNDSAAYWFSQAKIISSAHKNLSDSFILLEIRFHYERSEFAKVIEICNRNQISNSNIQGRIELLSYIINSKISLKQDARKEYSSLKILLSEFDFNLKSNKTRLFAFAYYTLGLYEMEYGDVNEAIKYVSFSLEIDKINANTSGIADNLYLLGKCEIIKQNITMAIDYFNRAYNIYTLLRDNQAAIATEARIILTRKPESNTKYAIDRLLEIKEQTNNRELIEEIKNYLKK